MNERTIHDGDEVVVVRPRRTWHGTISHLAWETSIPGCRGRFVLTWHDPIRGRECSHFAIDATTELRPVTA